MASILFDSQKNTEREQHFSDQLNRVPPIEPCDMRIPLRAPHHRVWRRVRVYRKIVLTPKSDNRIKPGRMNEWIEPSQRTKQRKKNTTKTTPANKNLSKRLHRRRRVFLPFPSIPIFTILCRVHPILPSLYFPSFLSEAKISYVIITSTKRNYLREQLRAFRRERQLIPFLLV